MNTTAPKLIQTGRGRPSPKSPAHATAAGLLTQKSLVLGLDCAPLIVERPRARKPSQIVTIRPSHRRCQRSPRCRGQDFMHQNISVPHGSQPLAGSRRAPALSAVLRSRLHAPEPRVPRATTRWLGDPSRRHPPRPGGQDPMHQNLAHPERRSAGPAPLRTGTPCRPGGQDPMHQNLVRPKRRSAGPVPPCTGTPRRPGGQDPMHQNHALPAELLRSGPAAHRPSRRSGGQEPMHQNHALPANQPLVRSRRAPAPQPFWRARPYAPEPCA
jgi:hypothetical protein